MIARSEVRPYHGGGRAGNSEIVLPVIVKISRADGGWEARDRQCSGGWDCHSEARMRLDEDKHASGVVQDGKIYLRVSSKVAYRDVERRSGEAQFEAWVRWIVGTDSSSGRSEDHLNRGPISVQ